MVKTYVETADLALQGIERFPEAGLPLGNGRMGSLIWLSQNAIHMQINRVDVFGSDSASRSVGITDSDFSGGCAFVDVEFGDPFAPVFGADTRQRLSVYDGEITVEGRGVRIQCRADMDEDALLFSVWDDRETKAPVSVRLRTLRYESQYVVGRRNYTHPSLETEGTVSYRRREHQLSKSLLQETARSLSLQQEFTEDDFYCRSLVEIGTRNRCATENRNATESVLTFAPDGEPMRFFITSSATFDRTQPKHTALSALLEERFDDVWSRSKAWWHDFWERAPILDLHSPDGYGQKITANIVYFMYLMASTSRGVFMPRYGGLLFATDGDFKMWGAQYWWHNQSCYFAALMNAGLFELTDSMTSHIGYIREACEKAAAQQWGSKGLWIPETTWFNGPCDIPDELAEEFQLLYREDKPWSERSEAFMAFSEGRNTFDTRFGWIAHRGEYRTERGFGPFGYVNHIFSATAKIAYWLWLRYQYTMDTEYLRQQAYPILQGTADFYANLPLIRRAEDGRLHFYHCNNHESIWGGTDTISELSAIHGILPIAIKAAEILDVDADKREVWKRFLADVVPMQTTKDPDAMLLGNEQGECWVNGRTPYYHGQAEPTHLSEPLFLYDLWTPETRDDRIRELGRNTLKAIEDAAGYPNGHVEIATLDLKGQAVARSCDPDAFEVFIKAMYDNENYKDDFCDLTGCGYTHLLDNRMSLREGPQALSAQRQGHLLSATATALCHAFPPAPGEEPVLYIFSSLPKAWDAKVKMRTAKNYEVEAERKGGVITSFSLRALANDSLLVHNPWEGDAVAHYADHDEPLHGATFQVHGSCRLEKA